MQLERLPPLEIAGPLAPVCLNRPAARNAFIETRQPGWVA